MLQIVSQEYQLDLQGRTSTYRLPYAKAELSHYFHAIYASSHESTLLMLLTLPTAYAFRSRQEDWVQRPLRNMYARIALLDQL